VRQHEAVGPDRPRVQHRISQLRLVRPVDVVQQERQTAVERRRGDQRHQVRLVRVPQRLHFVQEAIARRLEARQIRVDVPRTRVRDLLRLHQAQHDVVLRVVVNLVGGVDRLADQLLDLRVVHAELRLGVRVVYDHQVDDRRRRQQRALLQRFERPTPRSQRATPTAP
jgi:hypothetical protein